MGTFFKVISFPFRLIILILAYIVRVVLYLLGAFICLISDVAGAFLRIVGVFVNIIALVATVMYIKEMRSGDMSLFNGISLLVILWLFAFVIDGICFVGYNIGEVLKDLGEIITDKAMDLMTL